MKYIIPTIDVEAIRSLSKLGNFDDLILGKIGTNYHGTTKIAKIINDFGGSGTFYVDFAEQDHGLDKFKDLTANILKYNSDVQLHIHPQFIADKSRFLLNDYNRNEQFDILSNCINFYEKCVGEKPISFRAGGYGANDDTLSALAELGIRVDSSFYHKHKWCNISKKPINVVSKQSGLFELPITIFNNNISYYLLKLPVKNKTLTKKFDVDGCSKEELKLSFDSLNSSGIRIIILFLHSYSLLKWSPDYKQIFPDSEDTSKLYFILEYATSQGYKIESIKNIHNKLGEYLNDKSTLPQISTSRNISKSVYSTLAAKYRYFVRGK